MKKFSTLICMFIAFQFHAQDSIVNYLDLKGNITKKVKAYSVETLVKKENLWEHTKYHRSGKIKEKGQYKFKDKSDPVGTFYKFYNDGKMSNYFSFNENSELEGAYKKWFQTRNTSFEGKYSKGNKIGIWKYYHFNGKIACKQYFNEGKLMKTVFYDEEGTKIKADLIEFQEPKFEGEGLKKFYERIKEIHSRISFQVNGLIYIDLEIDTNGEINMTTSDKIPVELKRRLKIYFKNIKGWSPAIHMNRKIPYTYTFPLDFFVRFTSR
ncbi:hypothetical protein AAON49_01320 [Pseudotenacibaculum sp. MALMAid0570]|uniref:toxin-antitoxin system YwqK family antitoxin n=1 Tax=Pseudotenacibaculum sp. MALMAid0570 TaxID=3143938 RepID=UPI0032DF3D0B